MKKNILVLFTLTLLAVTSCQKTIDIAKEKETIKTVIENETKSYFTKNFEQYSKSFLHDENPIVLVASKERYGYAVGWEQIKKSFLINYEEHPEPITDSIHNTNYKIKIYKNSAWAVYDENIYNADGDFLRKVINVRFLEKKDNAWKIVYLGDVNVTSYEENADSNLTETEK